ncbi:MAG TPA: ATP-binding protein [Oscillospiraceae bacterium]|nr:ATP-binding protein [Oscillospiraceae bacterium]
MKSIRGKLFATYAGLLLLAVLLLGIGLTWFMRGFYLNTIKSRLAEEAQLTGELLKPLLSDYAVDFKLSETDAYIEYLGAKTNSRITLLSPEGVVIGDSLEPAHLMDNHLTRPEIIAARQDGTGNAIRFSETSNEELLYTAVSLVQNNQVMGYLRLALPLAQLNTALARLRYGLLLGMGLVLLLTLTISYPLAASVTRPLKEIADTAGRIAQGELSSRIISTQKDEIGGLAAAVNEMAESLQVQLEVVRENRDQLETILTTMVEGIVVFNQDGYAVIVNPAAVEMLNLRPDQWLGKQDLELIRNHALHEKICTVRKKKVYLEHELTLQFPHKRVLMVSLAPVRTNQREAAGVLAVLHDISQLRRLEQVRTDFVANVSHELRTPLTAIRGFAETLANDDKLDDETTARFVQIIWREAQRLQLLIEDILKLSQIESGQITVSKEPVDLQAVIGEVSERLAIPLQEFQFKVNLPEAVPRVKGDSGLLSQAIYNLLDNAIKYTLAGGTITIKVEEQQSMVSLQVSDSGIGIPDEAQERIFERFFRVDSARSRRLGGTGLGLAIVKHIVEAHQGRIELTSQEGVGTTITLLLPLYATS